MCQGGAPYQGRQEKALAMNEFLNTVIEGFLCGLGSWVAVWKLMLVWRAIRHPLDMDSQMRNG